MTDLELNIDENVREAFSEMIGKRCCRQRAGEYRSLSLRILGREYRTRKKERLTQPQNPKTPMLDV